jgi:hypothetical protein
MAEHECREDEHSGHAGMWGPKQRHKLSKMRGPHKSRHTQSVLERDGLTTAEEKLSKVRGPV